jgi:hypothetical protein
MSWRDNAPIYVAKVPRASLAERWSHAKHFE